VDGFHRACILLHKDNEQVVIELQDDYEKEELIRQELLNVTNYRHSGQGDGLHGYHSFNIGKINIPGQRNPKQRLAEIRKHFDFKDKWVLDLGCSVGGMLFHLEDIAGGVGVDKNEECIQSAKNIAIILERKDLEFMQYDLNNDLQKEISIIPDIIFLLSLKAWVKNWRGLYDFARFFNCPIILETNTKESGISELLYFRSHGKNIKLILDGSPDDITGNNRRKMYLIT
jgi:SAM-dependent methyltransferase